MDWTVFVVFILSITTIKCGITLEEINEEVAATLIPSLTDSTTINNEAQQSTTAATTFVEEDKKNTTLENVVEGGNKNTTSEISGDIDVYYGFQASPVIVKVLGDDGRFHWYLTKEGVGDTQKKYHQYGLNYPQGYFSPYEYGSLSNLYNSYQNIFPLLEGHMFNKYPWSHPINYHVTQSSPLSNVYTPYLTYPWNTAAPNELYNQFPNNNHGLSSWYYQKPSLNPYFSNRYPGMTPYLNAPFSDLSPMMNYLDYINPSHMNPYDTASIFNQFPNIFQQSIYPNLNNFYYHQLINNELQRNPYNFMTQFPHWFNEYGLDNPIFQDQYKLLNNIGGYDQVNMLHRAHSLFPVKSYRSPYTSESPNYNSIYDFEQNNMGQTYTRSNYIPSTPNQLFWRMSHYKPSIQYNSDYLLCRSPNITPFLATSYDYINRLPLDPIYRLFFKVLITSLANLYPRNAYFDEPVYPYTYPNTYHYNV